MSWIADQMHPVVHHAANTAAMVIPLIINVVHPLPIWLAYGPTFMGMFYYAILIPDKLLDLYMRLKHWYDTRDKDHGVRN